MLKGTLRYVLADVPNIHEWKGSRYIYGYEVKLTREGVEAFVPRAVAGKAQLLYSSGTSFPPQAREESVSVYVCARVCARAREREKKKHMLT